MAKYGYEKPISKLDTLRHVLTDRMREQVQQRLDAFNELREKADRIQNLVSSNQSFGMTRLVLNGLKTKGADSIYTRPHNPSP